MEQKGNADLRQLQTELTRFLMSYKFALDEMNTKIDILKQEFHYIHDYNPIEHVKSRLKTPESILRKVHRRGYEMSMSSIKENVRDIAGVRIICSFISDIYELSNMIKNQKDLTVVECKDYIQNPKPNGYKSLHLTLLVPIFMSDRVDNVYVEVQIRTIAMDFWASLEHKIYYKYNKEIPMKLVKELKEAADAVSVLDKKMEYIHKETLKYRENDKEEQGGLQEFLINNAQYNFSQSLLSQFLKLVE